MRFSLKVKDPRYNKLYMAVYKMFKLPIRHRYFTRSHPHAFNVSESQREQRLRLFRHRHRERSLKTTIRLYNNRRLRGLRFDQHKRIETRQGDRFVFFEFAVLPLCMHSGSAAQAAKQMDVNAVWQ